MPITGTDGKILSLFPSREPIHPIPDSTSNSTPQPRERSQPRPEQRGHQTRSSNRPPLESSTANRRPDAASLKMSVPNTTQLKPTLKHQTSDSTLEDAENRQNEKFVPQEPVRRSRSRNSFSVRNLSNDENTEIAGGEPGFESDGEPSGDPTARWDPIGLKQESDAGRMARGQLPKYTIPNSQDHAANRYDETISDIGDEYGDQIDLVKQVERLENETPSKATRMPVLNHPPLHMKSHTPGKKQVTISTGHERPAFDFNDERDSSPLPGEENAALPSFHQQPRLPDNSLSRHAIYRQQVEALPQPQEPPSPPLPMKSVPSKVSGHHEIFEEEPLRDTTSQPTSAPLKRPHDDLDYDLETLSGKTYTDLDQLPFLTDPRADEPPAAVDVNGTPLTIPQRLLNLPKMRPEDQEALFRSLADDDNEQVGHWFVQTFQDSLKKLMERRLERRKIALKYEMEVKKREMGVKVKIEDVEDELAGLRKGGGELIAGRGLVKEN